MKAAHAILLVEDNPADVKILQRALRQSQLNASLVVVRDGQEAVDYLLRQGPFADKSDWQAPAFVLLDLNLPRLTGCEVLQQLRRHEQLRTIPVVVMTTSTRDEDVEAVYACGANTFIEKPTNFQRCVDVLKVIGQYWLDTALLPPARATSPR